MADIIVPKILKGTRDFRGEEMWLRRQVLERITQVVENFGFEPLETPAFEFTEILEGKYDEQEKLLYRFEDEGGRKLALKYDLTVPTSRVVAMYPDIKFPYRRYQNQPVFRADKPQKGRYRQFLQFDFDVFGSASMLYDAEIICVIYKVFKHLGFPQFRILVNNRKLLNGMLRYAGFELVSTMSVLRILDKYQKIGEAGVIEELQQAGIDLESIKKLFQLIKIDTRSNREGEYDLSKLKTLLKDEPAGFEGVLEIERIFAALKSYGVETSHYILDPTLARGLEYYTGPIHEVVVDEPNIGSLCGGGRYDKLVGMFSDKNISATGTSLGIERIIDVMKELGMVSGPKSRLDVLITCAKEVAEESIKLNRKLHDMNINSEVYFLGAEHDLGLKSQLKYADRKSVPFVIIWPREGEAEKGRAIVKDMDKRTQEMMVVEDIPAFLKKNTGDKKTLSLYAGPGIPAVTTGAHGKHKAPGGKNPINTKDNTVLTKKTAQIETGIKTEESKPKRSGSMKEEDLGIRFGTVISAEHVKGTTRLHKIVVDMGDETRQIASGVPGDFEPGYLIGKQIPIKIDVKPVRIRGIESTARLLTTDDGKGGTVLVFPEQSVPVGSHLW